MRDSAPVAAAAGAVLVVLIAAGARGRPAPPVQPGLSEYAPVAVDAATDPPATPPSPTETAPPSVPIILPPHPTARPVGQVEPVVAPVVVTITPRPSPPRAPRVPQAARSTVAMAKAYALAMLGAAQYGCLDQIAIHESNWNPFDTNPTSGAYGIPQALPGSKMATYGGDWQWNPVTQVKWMIWYTVERYGSPCLAWNFWKANRWY